jgi:hypothetical protein
MAAMTMDYPVKDKWVFDVLKPGQTVRATLVVASDHAWLEGIVVTEEAKLQSGSPADADSKETSIGEEVPDFPLVNQDGKRIHLHQYRGKALLLTFIYTRCPLPNYCPLMSKNFAQILEQSQSDPKLAASAEHQHRPGVRQARGASRLWLGLRGQTPSLRALGVRLRHAGAGSQSCGILWLEILDRERPDCAFAGHCAHRPGWKSG